MTINPILRTWLAGCDEIRLLDIGQDRGMPYRPGVAFTWLRADGSRFDKIIFGRVDDETCDILFNRVYERGVLTHETAMFSEIDYQHAVDSVGDWGKLRKG